MSDTHMPMLPTTMHHILVMLPMPPQLPPMLLPRDLLRLSLRPMPTTDTTDMLVDMDMLDTVDMHTPVLMDTTDIAGAVKKQKTNKRNH